MHHVNYEYNLNYSDMNNNSYLKHADTTVEQLANAHV